MREKIRNRFSQSFTDQFTVDSLTDYVLEFYECFPTIFSIEELVSRLEKNLNGNFQLQEKNFGKSGRLDAQFELDGTFKLSKEAMKDKVYLKYILFHDLTHILSISMNKDGKPISGFYDLDFGETNGINEAYTEYLTQLRNQKLYPDETALLSDYRTIVNMIIQLEGIIGKKELNYAYFNDPNKLILLLQKNNMNYNDVVECFDVFTGKDCDVYSISKGEKFEDIFDYSLPHYAEKYIDLLENGIGSIDSIEKYNRKQQIMTNVMFRNYNIIDVNWIKYSHSVYLDTLYLMTIGELSKENRENYLKSTNIVYPCERIRTCLIENKNKSAQMLANLFDSSPKEYSVYASHLMGILHEHFSEYPDLVFEDALNDPLKYPMIGKYLKLNQKSTFGKIGYLKLETNVNDVSFYIFDDKKTIFASNGNAMIYDEDNGSIIYDDEQIHVVFEFEIENLSYRVDMKEENDKKLEVNVHRIPSEEEELEYFINEGEDHDGNLRQALERINGGEQLSID